MPPSASSSSSPPAVTRRRRQSSNISEAVAPAARTRSTSRKRKPKRSALQQSAAAEHDPITITEYNSQPHIASKPTNTYTLHNDRITTNPTNQPAASSSASTAAPALAASTTVPAFVVSFLSSLFLPANYPHSVTPDYLTFQVYDTIQASSSYLRGLLCTQAILAGIGVGSAAATPASATLNWITRDGVGMLGGMLFAWYGAQSFGINVKRWRLFADLINDIGLTLELLSPRFPHLFLVLACIGTLCRALCGVAAGATRASLMSHFALHNNIADISAKEGIQETAVTLAGLVLGWQAVDWLDGDLRLTWLVFGLLTAVHVWANVLAMRCLVLTSLDDQRADLCMTHFLTHRTTLTPKQAANRESIYYPLCSTNHHTIRLGGRLPQQHAHPTLSRSLQAAQRADRPFVLLPAVGESEKDGVEVVLSEGVEERDVLCALFCAKLYVDKMRQHDEATRGKPTDDDGDENGMDVLDECYDEGGGLFDQFYAGLMEAGWKSSQLQLDVQPWRYDWTS